MNVNLAEFVGKEVNVVTTREGRIDNIKVYKASCTEFDLFHLEGFGDFYFKSGTPATLAGNRITHIELAKPMNQKQQLIQEVANLEEQLNNAKDQLKNYKIKPEEAEIGIDLAKKTTYKAVLIALSKHPNDDVRFFVAENRYTPVEALRKLSKDSHFPVRLKVAGNSSTPLDVLENIMQNDNSLKAAVENNPSYKSKEKEEVRAFLKNISRKDAINLAENINTPPEVLNKLARHKDTYVTYLLSCNPNTPAEALNFLATLDDRIVRKSVFKHNNSSAETLAIIDDRDGLTTGQFKCLYKNQAPIIEKYKKEETQRVAQQEQQRQRKIQQEEEEQKRLKEKGERIQKELEQRQETQRILAIISNPETPIVELLKYSNPEQCLEISEQLNNNPTYKKYLIHNKTDPTDLEILDFLDWVYNADAEKLEAFAALDLSKKLSLWEKLILFFTILFNGKSS